MRRWHLIGLRTEEFLEVCHASRFKIGYDETINVAGFDKRLHERSWYGVGGLADSCTSSMGMEFVRLEAIERHSE